MDADVNNTGGKFAARFNNTGGQFAFCVADSNSNCKYLREFSKKFKMTLMPFTQKSWFKIKTDYFPDFFKSLDSLKKKKPAKKEKYINL